MNTVKLILPALLICGTALAKVKLTFQNGAVRTMESVSIKDERLQFPLENMQIPLTQITSAEFHFDGFSVEQCRALFDLGDYDGIVTRLAGEQASLQAAAAWQGNAAEWLVQLCRAQFHSGDFAAGYATVQALRRAGSPAADGLSPYEILILIELGRIEEAAKAFDLLPPVDNASAELIRARLAADCGENKEALQHLARLAVFHYREKEWMPCGLFFEEWICRKAGMPEAAESAFRELETLYPSGFWCRRAQKQMK